MIEGRVIKVLDSVVVAKGMREANMGDRLRIGEADLAGEIVGMSGAEACVQIYDATSGLGVGERAVSTGAPLSVELGPGLLGSIYDGVQRPLGTKKGAFSLDRAKLWHFEAKREFGDKVSAGDLLGTVRETEEFTHKIMVPPNVRGTVVELRTGDFKVTDRIGKIKLDNGDMMDITLTQRWPIRVARPVSKKLLPIERMITGVHETDERFPVGKGGVACISGGVGSGKTALSKRIAELCRADVVVYVGCGMRGSEMADIAKSLRGVSISRSIIVASSADMPITTREAAVYTGITIAEYYRDMGCSVAFVIDSLSAFTDAICKVSNELSWLSANGGYTVSFENRVAELCERAGSVICLGTDERRGAITAITTVSLRGDEGSDPVQKAALYSANTHIRLAREGVTSTINDAESLRFLRAEQWIAEL